MAESLSLKTIIFHRPPFFSIKYVGYAPGGDIRAYEPLGGVAHYPDKVVDRFLIGVADGFGKLIVDYGRKKHLVGHDRVEPA